MFDREAAEKFGHNVRVSRNLVPSLIPPLCHFALSKVSAKVMELKLLPLEAHVKAANVVAKLPFFAEMDPEALLTTFREKCMKEGGTLTLDGLLALFLGASRPSSNFFFQF